MLTLNCGKSTRNAKPNNVSEQDWLKTKKKQLEELFQSDESTRRNVNLFFCQEVDVSGGISSESLQLTSGLDILRSTGFNGEKGCSFIFYRPDEWRDVADLPSWE